MIYLKQQIILKILLMFITLNTQLINMLTNTVNIFGRLILASERTNTVLSKPSVAGYRVRVNRDRNIFYNNTKYYPNHSLSGGLVNPFIAITLFPDDEHSLDIYNQAVSIIFNGLSHGIPFSMIQADAAEYCQLDLTGRAILACAEVFSKTVKNATELPVPLQELNDLGDRLTSSYTIPAVKMAPLEGFSPSPTTAICAPETCASENMTILGISPETFGKVIAVVLISSFVAFTVYSIYSHYSSKPVQTVYSSPYEEPQVPQVPEVPDVILHSSAYDDITYHHTLLLWVMALFLVLMCILTGIGFFSNSTNKNNIK
jgi:hypothetical protein